MKQQTFRALSLVGAVAFAAYLMPSSPEDISWVRMILVIAPTLLLPLWLRVFLGKYTFGLLISGWALGLSYCWSPGVIAGSLAVIWLLYTLWLAYFSLWAKSNSECSLSSWSGKAAFLFLPIGAAWAWADRLGWQPMGFQSTIVLLTAVHFHYAGFLLLSLVDQYLLPSDRPWHKGLDLSLVAGVPLVAIGITLTEWNGPPWVETFAATVMALSGLGAGTLFMAEGWKNSAAWYGKTMIIGSLCLGGGMFLAIAYGWRPYVALPWLDIPWMYAVHGSLNASGIVLLLVGSLSTKKRNGVILV